MSWKKYFTPVNTTGQYGPISGSNGGSAITDYVIQHSSDSGTSWSTFTDGISTSTSAVVTSLANGTVYIFKVAAVNVVGTGDYSYSSSSVTPYKNPSSPSDLTGTSGDGQVSLAWREPASNGGNTITDYVIEYSSDGGDSWFLFEDGTYNSPTTTVTGLTNGTSYFVPGGRSESCRNGRL